MNMDDELNIIGDSPAEDGKKEAPSADPSNPSPQEVYERLSRYLSEIDTLLTALREGLAKGEEQLRLIRTFDERVNKLGTTIEPIETASVENEVESIRKHILSLQEMRDQVKVDIDNVKRIGEKITAIMSQYYKGVKNRKDKK